MGPVKLAVDVRHELGESVLWDDRASELVWVNIHAGEIWRHSERGGLIRHALPDRVGAIGLRRGRGYVVGLAKGFGFFDPTTGIFDSVAAVEADLPDIRLNDGRCDLAGNFLCGGIREGGTASSGLYRFSPGGQVERLLEGVTCANSTCFSPDGGTLYFADMPQGRIRRYEYDPAAPLGPERPFCDFVGQSGLPDGATVDSEGCLWSTHWGGGKIVRYAPDGAVLQEVGLPVTNPTCLAFGGPDFRTLFITTARFQLSADQLKREPLAGAVLKMRTDVAGLPEPRFNG
jgi:L-arabinonolactonase